MHPILFEVFGISIGSFGLFIILGAVAAWFVVRLLAGNEDKDIPLVFLLCICGGLIGVFLLRPITRIPEIIINWERFRHIPFRAFISLMFGEAVFYGGLIGGAVAMLLYCKAFKIPALPIADLFAPALAVAHGFGRIGCFLGGCCYGIHVSSSHVFAVVFPPVSAGAPPGVPLLATQLIEAVCLFIIAALLIIAYKKAAGTGLVVCAYGILYSVVRFILEFFRNDEIRGVYGVFSTSQYISIALFIVSVVLMWRILDKSKEKL